MKLIKLTQKNGETLYLNADKILTVVPCHDGKGCTVYHEPLDADNGADWTTVEESPDQIVFLADGRHGWQA